MHLRFAFVSVLLLAAPAAASEAVLYVHFDDARGDMALSVVAPPAGLERDAEMGIAAHSTGCLPAAGGTGQWYHSWDAYLSLRPEGPDLQSTDHRGLGMDLRIQDGTRPVLHWFLSSPAVSGLGPRPSVLPSVVLEASVRTGDALTVEQGSEEGEPVAHGRTGPHILAPGQPNHERIEDRDIYSFEMPLHLDATHVDGRDGLGLHVDAYIDVPGCNTPDNAFMLDEFALHTGPDHRPRLTWEVLDRLLVDGMATRPVLDHLIVVFQPRSVFGLADIADIHVGLEGPDGPASVGLAGEGGERPCDCWPPAPYYVFFAANMTDRPEGTYTWSVRLTDLAGDTVTGTVTHVHLHQDVDAPAPVLAGPLALAAAAALVRQRSSRRQEA